MGKRGPKRKYQSAYDFDQAVNAYFKNCLEDGDKFPDLAGMRIYLGLTQRTIDKYATGDDDEAGRFRTILDTAKDRRESWLVRRMVTEPKAANGCMSALKQQANGGYTDRPIDTSERSLTINVYNVGGEKAFK